MPLTVELRIAQWVKGIAALFSALFIDYGLIFIIRAVDSAEPTIAAGNALWGAIWLVIGCSLLRKTLRYGDRHGV